MRNLWERSKKFSRMGNTILMNIDNNIVWNRDTYNSLVNYLLSLREEEYKNFNLKLVSSKYEMIGIRIPLIRDIAKRISKTNFMPLFSLFNNEYYEVVLLEGILISYIKDIEEVILKLVNYVKKIDNWAICDTVVSSLKIVNKNKDKVLVFVDNLINSKEIFSVRFGFVILLDYYVNEEYLDVIFEYVKNNKINEYYVNMSISWLLCECYVKFTNRTYEFIELNKLSEFVIRKTVSKVNDSFRVSAKDKSKLKNLLI